MKLDRLTKMQNTVKKPTINDIQFPNMRNRGNSREKKWKQNNDNMVEKIGLQTTGEIDKIKRTYSMSLIAHRKDSKLMVISPKKKSATPEFSSTYNRVKLERNQFLLLGQSPKEKWYSQTASKKHGRKFTLLDLKLDRKKDSNGEFQDLINQKIPLETMFPGIRLSNSQVYQPQFGFLQHTQLHGMIQATNSFQQIQHLRSTKKKPLFNGKPLSIKKHKQEYPDELVLRKLVWDGKERRKVDHQLIYQKIVGKIRADRPQIISQIEIKYLPVKKNDQHLTAWQDKI